ncbi:hypothetical protein HXX76_014031 [Chlamydomonas incerta]|uniref:Post-SET domain-containing protein n=1 Tax=Chlamydomonas incerta TaxID=51695 RepID=A0A835VTM2_CHLIN|nr:hypothetical protein HXX76_014031 [Chlamydomonas incerta]|eukprot:KAG2424871.1 hypothetical protein HXX76_014031 [Chlamydomonas incerta]
MKRAASQREDRPAASSAEQTAKEEEAKERKRQAARIAGLLKEAEAMSAALSKAAQRRKSDAAQVLLRLPASGQRYVATLLAGKVTAQGVACSCCGTRITGGAGLAVHSCKGAKGRWRGHVLPRYVRKGALVEAEGGGGAAATQRCVLCGEWAGQGDGEDAARDHRCSMQCIMPVHYDCIGVTGLSDRYNACDPESEAGARLQEQLRRCAELWRAAMPTRLVVSVVALPPGQGEGAGEVPEVTSTMTYVAPSASIASACEGLRFVPGSTPGTAWPRFVYHGAIIASGLAKTPAAAGSAMARELRRWQQQQTGQRGQGRPELAENTARMALGRRMHACVRVNPLLFGGATYKLNHSCAPNMESSPVRVPAWGDACVASVLQPKPGAGPLPAMHDELCWFYGAVCDTLEEEMACECGAPGCCGLLVRWKGRERAE